jgi:hypothetical protein
LDLTTTIHLKEEEEDDSFVNIEERVPIVPQATKLDQFRCAIIATSRITLLGTTGPHNEVEDINKAAAA